jgi:hypothetical protein
MQDDGVLGMIFTSLRQEIVTLGLVLTTGSESPTLFTDMDRLSALRERTVLSCLCSLFHNARQHLHGGHLGHCGVACDVVT